MRSAKLQESAQRRDLHHRHALLARVRARDIRSRKLTRLRELPHCPRRRAALSEAGRGGNAGPPAGGTLLAASGAFALSANMLMLTNFSLRRPQYEIVQERALAWLSDIHAASEATLNALSDSAQAAFAARFSKLVDRCACGPEKIGSRGHVTADLGACEDPDLYDVRHYPRGKGSAARAQVFAEVVDAYFEREFAADAQAP